MSFILLLLFFIERKMETEKLAVLPKKSSARRQKTLQTEKVGGLLPTCILTLVRQTIAVTC